MSQLSNGGGSADNSDNSGILSFGNNSFGFNFDSEDAMMNSSSDGDGSGNGPATNDAARGKASSQPANKNVSNNGKPPVPPKTSISTKEGHDAAAAAAVENLKNIASQFNSKADADMTSDGRSSGRKRKVGQDDEKSGYNSDDEGTGAQNHVSGENDNKQSASAKPSTISSSSVQTPVPVKSEPDILSQEDSEDTKKKSKLQDSKREERNAREKERSFRISRQINELRSLLSSGGVIVPKGTKSSVLSEAANYIRMLQQHQYRSEM